MALPNSVLASNITCVPTNKGWLHLTAVINVSRPEVVGWHMPSRKRPPMQAIKVIKSLRATQFSRRPRLALDWLWLGTQTEGFKTVGMSSKAHRRLSCGMRSEVSRNGNFNSACTGRLWSRLKVACTNDRKFTKQRAALNGVMDEVLNWLKQRQKRTRK